MTRTNGCASNSGWLSHGVLSGASRVLATLAVRLQPSGVCHPLTLITTSEGRGVWPAWRPEISALNCSWCFISFNATRVALEHSVANTTSHVALRCTGGPGSI